MNPFSIILEVVDFAIDQAQKAAAALAKTKEEEAAHLAELHTRLDARRARISARAEENRRIVAGLPPDPGPTAPAG